MYHNQPEMLSNLRREHKVDNQKCWLVLMENSLNVYKISLYLRKMQRWKY